MLVVDPRAVGAPPGPAPPRVEALFANHRPTPLRPAPVLPAGTFDLEIRYTAASLEAPERTRFRYLLEGYDRDWVEVKDRRTAYYPNLPPGEFVFRVAAADQGAARGAKRPPSRWCCEPYFWQTGWFKRLLAGLGAWALYGLYRLRAGRLEARAAVAEERNRIARDIHDTLAQDLAAILDLRPPGPERRRPGRRRGRALLRRHRGARRQQPGRGAALAPGLAAAGARRQESGPGAGRRGPQLAAGGGAEIVVRARARAGSAGGGRSRAAADRQGSDRQRAAARRRPAGSRSSWKTDRREIVLRVRDDGAGFDPRPC